MAVDDLGPAYPMSKKSRKCVTIRDYIADLMILSVVCVDGGTAAQVADKCYELADAMIAQRHTDYGTSPPPSGVDDGGWAYPMNEDNTDGVTFRDEWAISALNASYQVATKTPAEHAADAYAYADALVAKRNADYA